MVYVVAENDLTADAEERGLWQADGEDPFFLLHFPVVRPRYLVMRLTTRDRAIDPTIYINKGSGFSEKNSRPTGSGRDLLIIADIGAFGTICSLRLDPATEPCRFSFEVAEFTSRPRMESYIREQKEAAANVKIVRLGKLPRFHTSLAIRLGRRRSSIARYVTHIEELASTIPPSEAISQEPWLSIVVPVYNAPARYLDDVLQSFRKQDTAGVELILSDDGSDSTETLKWLESVDEPGVTCVLNGTNRGIALTTNAGLERARGRWVALLDHDDVIAPHGLRVIRSAMVGHEEAFFFYTDELVVDDNLRPTGVMLKPAFDPVLLSGVNYINHFSIYRRKRLEEIGFLRNGFEGSQDYDLLLRYLKGLDDGEVVHIPYPAYWWRRTGKTYSRTHFSQSTDSARRALSEHFATAASDVTAALTPSLHRVRFVSGRRPKISIIIPNKDSPELISQLLEGIYERTAYPELETIVIDNGSTNPSTLAIYADYARRFASFSFRIEKAEFNFSHAVNEGMAKAAGDHLLLLNNDVEIIEEMWLDEMVQCLAYPGVGIVGAKLLYADHRLQHAGVVTGFGGLAGHWYLNKPANFPGPMGRLHVRSSMSCVTGAVMLISANCAKAVGRWDEEHFAVAYNDVDYCIRAYKAGFRTVWTPFACLIHHESLTRGSDKSPEKRQRFEREKENLRRLHETQNFVDPASNPNYGRDRSDPKIILPSELPAPRRWFGNPNGQEEAATTTKVRDFLSEEWT